jgi:outer membrane protein W
MKKCILWLFAFVALTAPLHAGGIGPMLAYWDTNDAGDDTRAGVRLTVDLGPTWNFELRAAWFDGLSMIGGSGVVYNVEAFPVDIGLSHGFTTGAAQPYVGFGVSYVDIRARPAAPDPLRRTEVEVPEEVGWFGLAGLDYPISGTIAFFGEVYYREIEAKADSTDLPDFNIELSGPGANVGLILRF